MPRFVDDLGRAAFIINTEKLKSRTVQVRTLTRENMCVCVCICVH